ncbi:hypothetical protein, partial [Halorubellus sp. PRR65]|uniref:hypothetical protein n=1 Tax=Halorubellus sp. PRR65 TaxID=3098148 RepID=UPI002B2613A7
VETRELLTVVTLPSIVVLEIQGMFIAADCPFAMPLHSGASLFSQGTVLLTHCKFGLSLQGTVLLEITTHII